MILHKIKTKIKQVYLPLASTLALSFSIFSCSEKETMVVEQEQKQYPLQVIKDAQLLRSLNGGVDIEVKTPLIEMYSGDSARMISPKGIEVLFLNPDLTSKAYLTADYAINYNNTNLYYVKDNVVIIDYKEQDTFYCQDLYWIKDSALLRTDLPVRRQSSAGTDYGDGLRATESFDSVKIKNPHGSQLFEEND